MPSVKFVVEGRKQALLIAICYKETPGGPDTLDVSHGLWSLKKLLIGMDN